MIIITGTPGTGKSTHAQVLSEESPISLTHINIGDWVKERRLYEDFNQEWQSYTVDEDKVIKGPESINIFLIIGRESVAGRTRTCGVSRRGYPRLAYVRDISRAVG